MTEFTPLPPHRRRLVEAGRPLEAQWVALFDIQARLGVAEGLPPPTADQEATWRMFFYAGAKAVWGLLFEDCRVSQAFFGTDAPTAEEIARMQDVVEAEIAIWVDSVHSDVA